MFTKRHYEALAEIIRTFRVDNGASYDAATQEVSDFVRSPLAYTFAMALRRDNPSFDLDRFIKACEPPKPIEPWHGQGPRPTVAPPPADLALTADRVAIIAKAVADWDAAGRPAHITRNGETTFTERGLMAAWRAVDAALNAAGLSPAVMGEMRDAYGWRPR